MMKAMLNKNIYDVYKFVLGSFTSKKLFEAVLFLLLLTPLLSSSTDSFAAEFCSDEFYIDETLPNGARWDMCWEHRQREGIVLNAVFFTPKGGSRRMVLNQAAVAQIHVPYDDNGTRFHDLSDFGIGGQNLLSLNPDECPSGTIYPVAYVFENQSLEKDAFCKQIKKNDIGFKSGANSANEYYLSLFNVSPVGAYYYIPTWRFMDDGTIEPRMGATGALQRFSTEENRGWRLGDNRIGLAHVHNFFWRFDFDINQTHLDDVVEEVNFALNNGRRTRQTTVFNTETARQVNPNTMRHWRVSDKNTRNSNGHNISYDILLNESGHQDVGPAIEPFTFNDFFVTKQNNQEKFASHNTSGGENLAEFVNGENISNDDIVIWAGITFYHMPRSEDAPHMDVHWSNLRIVPRDLSARNSLSNSTQVNTAPQITAIANQSNQLNTSVGFNVQASDSNGDNLSFSATGLPPGLSINSNTGQINGRPNQAGNYTVSVSVSDGQNSTSSQFTWNIVSDNSGNGTSESGGGGSISMFVLFLLIIVSIQKRRVRQNV